MSTAGAEHRRAQRQALFGHAIAAARAVRFHLLGQSSAGQSQDLALLGGEGLDQVAPQVVRAEQELGAGTDGLAFGGEPVVELGRRVVRGDPRRQDRHQDEDDDGT